MSLDYGFSALTTILYIKAKFQFTGCNDFHLCEHRSKLLVLLLSSQKKTTDNYKSLGDTAVLILHIFSEFKSTSSERVLHYCFHATYRGSFEWPYVSHAPRAYHLGLC